MSEKEIKILLKEALDKAVAGASKQSEPEDANSSKFIMPGEEQSLSSLSDLSAFHVPETHMPFDDQQSKEDSPQPLTEWPHNNHQTLVLLNVSKKSDSKFIERCGRLVSSLNTPDTMKADIATVVNGLLYQGFVLLEGTPGSEESYDIPKHWEVVVEVRKP